MSSTPRQGSSRATRSMLHRSKALHWSNWNLLLLVPLLVLATPLYNDSEPRLAGFPYFYWLQFLFIPIGVLCVWVVYRKTRNVGRPADRDGTDRDADGGAWR